MPFLYDCHTGGFYSEDDMLGIDELLCETCGDSDWEIGYYENTLELWELLKDRTSIFGTGGYPLDLVCSFITGTDKVELEGTSDIELLQRIQTAIATETEGEV